MRIATVDDTNAIHKLGENVSEFSVSNKTVNFWPKNILVRALASDDVTVLVAQAEQDLVGFIIASYSQGLRKATIENIFVTLEHRGEGVGGALLAELLQRLAEQGCEYAATSIPGDADGALRIYEGAGFTRGASFVWLDRSLTNAFKRT